MHCDTGVWWCDDAIAAFEEISVFWPRARELHAVCGIGWTLIWTSTMMMNDHHKSFKNSATLFIVIHRQAAKPISELIHRKRSSAVNMFSVLFVNKHTNTAIGVTNFLFILLCLLIANYWIISGRFVMTAKCNFDLSLYMIRFCTILPKQTNNKLAEWQCLHAEKWHRWAVHRIMTVCIVYCVCICLISSDKLHRNHYDGTVNVLSHFWMSSWDLTWICEPRESWP